LFAINAALITSLIAYSSSNANLPKNFTISTSNSNPHT
jgi:hypothetical protein